MICSRCGKEAREGGCYCPYCGAEYSNLSAEETDLIRDSEFKAFIGNNSEKYLKKFKKFTGKGVATFALTWHWPAFFAGGWWLLYRKMYFWALVAFDTWMIPHVALPAMFVWGAVGNYLYYLQAKRKIQEYKLASPVKVYPEILAELGGVNRWIWVVGNMLSVLFVGLLILILVILYQFITRSHIIFPDYLDTRWILLRDLST